MRQGLADRLALPTEVVVTGVLVLLGSLPVVTALPVAVAGAGHLRRTVDGRGGGLGSALGEAVATARALPAACVGLPLVVVVTAVDALAAGSLDVPGAVAVAPVCAVVAVVALVTGLRLVGCWQPGDPPGSRDAVARALRLGVADPSGTALLVAVLGSLAAVGTLVPVVVPLVPGVLVLAAAGVERRRARRAEG